MPRRRLLGIVVSSVLAGCFANAAGDPIKVDGGDRPRDGVRDIRFEVVWEQPAETDDYLIGRLIDTRRDAAGNICVADYQLKDLKIFAPDGRWLRTVGREGEGPGECDDVRRVFLRAKGEMGLLQGVPGEIVWFHADGTPAERMRVGGDATVENAFTAVGAAVQQGASIYAWTSQFSQESTGDALRSSIVRLAPDGALGPPIYVPGPDPDDAVTDGMYYEGRDYRLWDGRWHPGADGGIWVAPHRDKYVLEYWQEGRCVRHVTRSYHPVQRNAAGRDDALAGAVAHGFSNDRVRVGTTAPVVTSLRLGDDGNLWVRLDQGGYGPPDQPLAIFDVFTPDGVWIEQRRWHIAPPLGRWRVLDDRSLVMLREDEDGTVASLVLFAAAGRDTP